MHASMSEASRLIRVVYLRLRLYFCRAAGILLYSLVISFTEFLRSRASDRTVSEDTELTRGFSTGLWTIHDVHHMAI